MTATRHEGMHSRAGEPLYFGGSDAPLFGCLHTPASSAVTHAALLLPPAGHEYMSAHRSLRQLAVRLAERGCMALRMDFRGCGDSSGAKDSGCLAQWCEDAELGLGLLAARAPAAALQVVGLRLGASVAVQLGVRRAASEQPLAAVALWDPVMDGAAYLRDALSLQHKRYDQHQHDTGNGPFEVLGHRWSAALAAELRALVLADSRPAPAARILLIDTLARRYDSLLAPWRSLGAELECRTLQAPELWSGDGQVALVPTGVVQAVSEWLTRP